MKTLRLAVILDQSLIAGGGFQQALNSALEVTQLDPELVTPIFYTSIQSNISVLSTYGISSHLISLSYLDQFFYLLRI